MTDTTTQPTPPGWYPAPGGVERWWDGTQWTGHTRALTAAPAPQVFYPYAPAVTKTTKDTSHVFHLLMTVFTCGLWGLFVWLPITIWHKIGPRKKSVTRYR